jgi:hypothetical protein
VDFFTAIDLLRRRFSLACGIALVVGLLAFPGHSKRLFLAAIDQRSREVTRQLNKVLAPTIKSISRQAPTQTKR